MKTTNSLNLPQPIVDALRNDDYDSGDADISVTGLIAPVQQTILRQKYADELEIDVCDQIYALLGKSVHTILEKADDGSLVEKRFDISIDGFKLTGQVDRISEDRILSDWKVMSVWEAIYGLSNEKTEQLNCYTYLARKHGFDIESLEIVGIFRDWQMSKAKYDAKYPQKQVQRFPIALWTIEDQEAFIEGKLKIYKRALEGDVVPCSPEDRWQKEEKWAVMKEGRKTAVKLYDNESDAYRHVAIQADKKFFVEHRPGENQRCNSYCIVNKVCPQYQRMRLEDSNARH